MYMLELRSDYLIKTGTVWTYRPHSVSTGFSTCRRTTPGVPVAIANMVLGICFLKIFTVLSSSILFWCFYPTESLATYIFYCTVFWHIFPLLTFHLMWRQVQMFSSSLGSWDLLDHMLNCSMDIATFTSWRFKTF